MKELPTSNTESKAESWRMVWDILKAHNPEFFEHGDTGRQAVEIEIRRLQALDKDACPHPAMHGVQAWKCDACGKLTGEKPPVETTPRHLQPSYVLEQIMNNSTDPWARGVARTCLMSSSVEPVDHIMPAGWASITPDQLAGAVIPEKASGRTPEQDRISNANLDQVDWPTSRYFKGDDTKPCENCGECFSQHGKALECPSENGT